MLTDTKKKIYLGILAQTRMQIVHIFQILIEKIVVSGVCHAALTHFQVNEDSHYFCFYCAHSLDTACLSQILYFSLKSCHNNAGFYSVLC